MSRLRRRGEGVTLPQAVRGYGVVSRAKSTALSHGGIRASPQLPPIAPAFISPATTVTHDVPFSPLCHDWCKVQFDGCRTAPPAIVAEELQRDGVTQ